MTGAVKQVAALEAETAQAVSAAQAAQDAAAAALASAAVLENQVVIAAAEHASEIEGEVTQNKDDVSWLKERMATLEAGHSAIMQTLDTMAATLLVLTAEPEPLEVSTALPLQTSEALPPSSVVVADLQEAENPAPSPAAAQPSAKQKRHRLL